MAGKRTAAEKHEDSRKVGGVKTKAAAAGELARLMGESGVLECLPREDAREIVRRGLAVVVRVSQGEDVKTAFEAGKWLVEYGTRMLSGGLNGGVSAERSVLVAELREIYKQALPAGKVIESTSEVSE